MKITTLFKDFFDSEKSSGLILIICTILSLLLSNVYFANTYQAFWHSTLFGNSITHWINDGLMTIFFLLIGLELERELYDGELSSFKDAFLPVIAALGGMIIPASIYLYFNWGTATQSGAGIPMATDIAFALAILSLLGRKVPTSLKIFLTALAVIDDLGAIMVIAIFYTKTILWSKLFIALSIFILLLIFNRLKIRNLIPFLIGGIFMWYFMLQSGVHATIAGVLLAFAIPFGNGDKKSTSYILQHFLHKPVAYFILPLFALANTAINFSSFSFQHLSHEYQNIGILLGLILGKPLGIFIFVAIALKLKICSLPYQVNLAHILGIGFLGGIGFTMSIFITLVAFTQDDMIDNAKIYILMSSCIAGLIGYIYLNIVLKKIV